MNDAWSDVEHGRRQLDWAICFGDLTAAEYLTPLGRQVGATAVADLTAFFGTDWLHRATHPSNPKLMPPLAPFFPDLMKAPAYIEAIGLWARLQVLIAERVAGVYKLRANLRANPVREEFRHGIAQARLGAQALTAGAQVTVEPTKPGGGPGDLLAVRDHGELFIEFRAIGPDRALTAYDQQTRAASRHLRMLETQHEVFWSGRLPDDPDPAWLRTAEAAAVRAATSQQPVELTADGAQLRVSPGRTPTGSTIEGAPLETDQGPRLLRALTHKAVQTVSAGLAWIWLEDDGALWPLADFVRYALPDKVDTLADALAPLFTSHQHVLGVVLTSSPLRLSGPAEPVSVERAGGAGYLRTLPDGRVRESVIVHRPLVVPAQYALVRELCADEPAWLDAALALLGVPGRLDGADIVAAAELGA